MSAKTIAEALAAALDNPGRTCPCCNREVGPSGISGDLRCSGCDLTFEVGDTEPPAGPCRCGRLNPARLQ